MKKIRCTNNSLSLPITMSLGAGTALGVAFDDIAVGVGFGAAAGLLFGLASLRRAPDPAEAAD